MKIINTGRVLTRYVNNNLYSKLPRRSEIGRKKTIIKDTAESE